MVRSLKSRATISVLCPTAHPGPLVSGVLEELRAIVDEVIVAADARVGAEDLGHYALVADRVLRYEHFGANRHWSWLTAQASADWLLLLDGDELPSGSFIEMLPDLVADRRIDQYSMPIHWPWPDAATRLAAEPWQSDQRIRLIRNNGRTFFAGRKHMLAQAAFPIRYLDEPPVYHLDLIPDVARRRAKVQRYDGELFGLLTAEGLPVNEAFYLPENRAAVASLPIPADDRERISRALEARRQAPEPIDPDDLPLHDRATLARHWAGQTLGEDAYRAEVELARPLPAFAAAGSNYVVWVRLRNTGTARWPGTDQQPLIQLGARWRAPGSEACEDAGRAMLPHAVQPGESALTPLVLGAPRHSGPTDLVLDAVHELVRWFDCPAILRVEVGPSVADRLADLRRRHGPVVPLDAVWQVRNAVEPRDALLQGIDASSPSRPSDARIAKLVEDLPVGEWALDGPTLERLVDVVRAQRPSCVAEFGSGTSTVVLARLLAKRHRRRRPRLISFEQDPSWVQRVRHELAKRGLDDVVTVVHLALGSGPSGSPVACYEMTEEGRRLLEDHPPQLVLIDGPSLASGASRLGVIDLVAPFLTSDATVLLDDALRDAELCVAREWDRRPDVQIDGIRLIGKGVLEGRLVAQPGR